MHCKLLVALILSASSVLAVPQTVNIGALTSAAGAFNSVVSDASTKFGAATSIIANPGSAASSIASEAISGASSVASAVGSAITGAPAALSSKVAGIRSDIDSHLSQYTTIPNFSSIIDNGLSAAISGPSQVASYISALPSSINSDARAAIASDLNNAASRIAQSPSQTGASPSPSTPGSAPKVALMGSIMGAAALLAVVLAL